MPLLLTCFETASLHSVQLCGIVRAAGGVFYE